MSAPRRSTDTLKVDMVAIADCLDCPWTYQYTGAMRGVGEAALAAGRNHAACKQHQVVVHRSTEYDGREE